jgi:hypothetical protein
MYFATIPTGYEIKHGDYRRFKKEKSKDKPKRRGFGKKKTNLFDY